jgi:Leucine-rich repeat (LRR) protein
MRLRNFIISIVCSLMAITAHGQSLSPESLDTMKIYYDISHALENPNAVFRLDLSKKKLKEIPPEVFRLTNLNELILDKNKIDSIPDEIGSLIFLQKLSMAHNNIEKIPVVLCSLKSLEELNLADNFLFKIPEEIGGLTSLKKLILWDNPIEYYPDTLEDLSNLLVLDLLNNQMSANTQERIRGLLPKTKIILSLPCKCEDE